MSEVVQLELPPVKKPMRGRTPVSSPMAGEWPTIRTDAVYVLFTTIDETLEAVRTADALGALAAPVTLIHVRAVPYPLPVDRPSGLSPVETCAFMDGLIAEGLDVRVHVFLCRHERLALPMAFKPRSLIAIGGRHRRGGPGRLWPTRPERWRRWLEAAGHFVLFVDADRDLGIEKGRGDA